MTHIDPFAPADSPQHPRNWNAAAAEQPAVVDASPDLYLIGGEPIPPGDTAEDLIEEREIEYADLIADHGQEGQKELWSSWDYTTGTPAPEELPTLAELRNHAMTVAQQPEKKPTKKRGSRTKPADATVDLDSALEALRNEQ